MYWLSQLEKVQEFISSIQRSEDTNFKLAGNNLEKILHEKVYSEPVVCVLCVVVMLV